MPAPVTPAVSGVRFHLDTDAANDSAFSSAAADNTALSKQKSLGAILSAHGIPLTTAALAAAWAKSKAGQDLRTEVSDLNAYLPTSKEALKPSEASQLTRQQYLTRWSRGFAHHIRWCLHRQKQMYTRSPEFVGPRIGSAVFMGFVGGSLAWQLGTGPLDFLPRIGTALFSMIFMVGNTRVTSHQNAVCSEC